MSTDFFNIFMIVARKQFSNERPANPRLRVKTKSEKLALPCNNCER